MGFYPVQQGGGIGQGVNKIYIGWSDGGLKVTVDGSDQGVVAFTSSPDFINGINVTGDSTFWNSLVAVGNISAQGILQAAGQVYAGNGAAYLNGDGNVFGPTWNGWLSSYLGASFPGFWNLMSTIGSQPVGGVGTYGLFRVGGGGACGPGALVAGVNVLYSDCQATSNYGNAPGTWMIMGGVNNSDAETADSVTLCMRVA
ncbi:hypothetical protein D3C84_741600 [compost metagenome]